MHSVERTEPESAPTVSCSEVSKRFGKKWALRDISVEFNGGVTAILGANGAGKTTLMNILATLSRPTSGRVSVAGKTLRTFRDTEVARKHVGLLPQRFSVINGATVKQNVEYAAWAHGVRTDHVPKAARSAMHRMNLEPLSQNKARILSGGQRQRLGIACAIAHTPSVLLLDEPTVGLDPIQRLELRQLILELGGTGTVVLNTHLVEDVAEVAAHAVVLRAGTVVFNGTTESLADLSPSRASQAGLTAAVEQSMIALLQ